MNLGPEVAEKLSKAAAIRDKSILFASVAILGVGQSLMFIIMGPLARDIGLSEIQYGLIFSLANLALVFAAPFWGQKSDGWGRKPVLIVGLLGCSLGYLLLALALQVGLLDWFAPWPLFFLLLSARTVYASMSSAIYPSSAAYIADTTDRANRAKGMALIGAANSVGIIVGPAIGGGLALIGILFPMYFASALAAGAAITAYFLLREPSRHVTAVRQAELKFTDKRILPFLILWFGFFFAFTSLNFITAFYIEDRFNLTETADVVRIASVALLCMGSTEVFIQIFLLQIIKMPQIILLRLCLPMLAAGLLVIATTTSISVLYFGYAFIGLAFSCANPGISGGASLSVKPHEQGAAAGFVASATTGGVLLGPVIGTSLYGVFPTLPLLSGAALIMLLAVYALFVKVPDVEQDAIG